MGVTRMLRAWKRGDLSADTAAGELYAELRRRARAHLRRERRGHSLSPTDLVHDIYLRLSRQQWDWSNRQQFYATASRMMRRVLVDHARAKRAHKRFGVQIDLDEGIGSISPHVVDVLAIDTALNELSAEDERQAQLVELRFFGGLTLEEAATSLSISLPTAKRDWRFARAWLARRLGGA
jgi:RNA polymerase sigma factor (TIGR02999 family)